jgi:uncharacterized protein (UPF0333 family)
MDDRAQVTMEYLIMLAVVLSLAAIAVLLAINVLSIKEGLKANIRAYRGKLIG